MHACVFSHGQHAIRVSMATRHRLAAASTYLALRSALSRKLSFRRRLREPLRREVSRHAVTSRLMSPPGRLDPKTWTLSHALRSFLLASSTEMSQHCRVVTTPVLCSFAYEAAAVGSSGNCGLLHIQARIRAALAQDYVQQFMHLSVRKHLVHLFKTPGPVKCCRCGRAKRHVLHPSRQTM